MKSDNLPATQTAVYGSVDELARELGISRASAYSGLREGVIPSIRLSKRFIIPRSAIQAWLQSAGTGEGR
jgi:excisionase family DNA binding protein